MKRLNRFESPRNVRRRLPDAFPGGGLAYINSRLVFTSCNDIQAAYFGSTSDGVIGRRAQDVAPGNPEFWRSVERVFETGERFSPAELTTSWPHASGTEEHRYVVSCIPDLDLHGDVQGVSMTSLDVTPSMQREREAEMAMRERIDQLEKTTQEKDFFVGLVSHEIRAPLANIYGYAHFLNRLDELD